MRIYFMGICGTAMGNVARMLREMGHEVLGADTGIYPPMSDQLAAAGIEILEGYDAARLEKLVPELVVVGNVISRGNPEIEWLLDTQKFPYVSLPQLLRERVLCQRKNIVVCGTHGKTTTSTIAATLLDANAAEPGYLIGGVPQDLPGGSCAGKTGGTFVIEGDEYDSAFFDKRSKFIHYLPHVLVLNNLEFDHADIFRDLEDIKRTFRHVIRLVPRSGFIVANGDDPNLASLINVDWTQVLRVGMSKQHDLRLENFTENAQGSRFELLWKERHWATIEWAQHGLYNARNAAMAILASALALYPDDPKRLALDSLKTFRGVKRRQDVLLENRKLVVLEDFGHHPTAIQQTLASLRVRYPKSRLVAAFEPRSNTARSRVFQKNLPQALSDADQALIGAVHRADKMAAEDRLDVEELCEALSNTEGGTIARHFAKNEDLLEAVCRLSDEHRDHHHVFVFFSNGSFDGILPRFVAYLQGE